MSQQWREKSELSPSDGAAGHEVGWTLGLKTETLVVRTRVGNRVYVFDCNATEQQWMKYTVQTDTGRYGSAVAIFGGTVVVGAPQYSSSTSPCVKFRAGH